MQDGILQQAPGTMQDGIPSGVIARGGLRTISMGHGRYKSAVPASKGDKLGMAAEIGDLVKVNKLISKGVDVNITNPVSGVTPLGVAAERGYVDIVKVMLAGKANVEAQTMDGLTPLHIATQFGQLEVVKLLIAASANPNNNCSSPLTYAHPLGVAQPFGGCGNTPLSAATVRNANEVMKVLIEAKADVDQPVSFGTPMHLACRQGHHEALLTLLRGGADVVALNAHGEMPLETAIINGYDAKHLQCAAMLRPLNARLGKPAFADKDHGYLKEALDRYTSAALRSLEDLSADARDAAPIPMATELVSAVMRNAAHRGDVKTVKDLADAELINEGDSCGMTALHEAASEGHAGVCAALIQRRADVNVRNEDDSTPLHLACIADHALIVRLLLKHKARVLLKDINGAEPLEVAEASAEAVLRPHVEGVRTAGGEPAVEEEPTTALAPTSRAAAVRGSGSITSAGVASGAFYSAKGAGGHEELMKMLKLESCQVIGEGSAASSSTEEAPSRAVEQASRVMEQASETVAAMQAAEESAIAAWGSVGAPKEEGEAPAAAAVDLE